MFLGHGETIAKFCLANSIIREMMHGQSAQDATEDVLKKMTARLNNTAGKKNIWFEIALENTNST